MRIDRNGEKVPDDAPSYSTNFGTPTPRTGSGYDFNEDDLEPHIPSMSNILPSVRIGITKNLNGEWRVHND